MQYFEMKNQKFSMPMPPPQTPSRWGGEHPSPLGASILVPLALDRHCFDKSNTAQHLKDMDSAPKNLLHVELISHTGVSAHNTKW